jgi:protein gp37
MSVTWNPWHGCTKISEGCRNCYVYRIDEQHGKDSSIVEKTLNFNLPVKKKRSGEYKIPSGEEIYTCFSSDFFLDEADPWRSEAWKMIRERKDCHFLIITKRIDRFTICLPEDWGKGYDNVTICSTVENQDRANYRLPILLDAPIKHKMIICEPLLEHIDLVKYLGDWVELVIVGGESGSEARICKYDWVLDLHQQCRQKNIPFHFKQTGANFYKDGQLYKISRKFQHSQALKAGLDFE